ncbi:hypothetical protein [Peredibacter starrii]|uniref:Uncharacterized protein n=1 Tax=Peredibacter starrii TaxID=28202 RepID=A0AAX4HM71_9BACT|nr:hypothetical protein [Peredibacter starrii]WPU64268.1 hypothetical protein SOO65_16360 [Peredibacter starrii]
MKIQSMIKFLPLLTIPLLQSCGGPATSTAQLSVSSSFVATAGSLGLGGYIVVGENETTSKKFVISLSGSTQTKVQLEKGRWKFAAVGWDGNNPFEGNTVCGSVPTTDLSADTSTVEIQVTSAACTSAALLTELNVKSIAPLACDIFYNYNQATNTFSPLTTAFSDSFCNSLPNDYRSDFSLYRVQSLNINNLGQESAGFISECKSLTTATSLNLPSNKVPLLVKYYKNSSDCTNNRRAQTYLFKGGLTAGNPNFDHMINYSGTRLLLSSARTKKGRSPFMTEIPRINCGMSGTYSDCFTEPVVDGHINVPFHGSNYGDQIVLKGVDPSITSCTPAIMNSKFYFTENCSVDEGRVRIQPQRNELLCQATPFYQSGFNIKDMYFRNNKLYILRRDTGVYKDFVAVYNLKGKKLAEYDLGSTDHSKFAVSADGSKMVGYSTSQLHTYTVIGNTVTPVSHGLSGVTDIEIHPDGTYIYVAYGALLKSYTFAASFVNQQNLTNAISQLNIGGGYIYAVESGNNAVHWTALTNNGMLGSDFVPSQGAMPSDVTAMTVTDASKIYYHDGNNVRVSTSLPSFGASVDVSMWSTSPVGMVVFENKLYLANNNGLYVLDPATGNPLSSNTGNCAESLTFTLGTASKTLSVVAHQNQPLNPLYNEAYSLIGRTFFTDTNYNFYYFQSLAHNDEGVRTGGKLERIQEMLSPEALGGFLSEYATCNDVKAAAPFTRDLTYFDESVGKVMPFSISVTTGSEYLSPYICDDIDSQGSSCTATSAFAYDLVLNFSHTGIDRREKMRIKLKCGAKKGSFESADVEFSPSEIRKELLLWNTNSDRYARFESYSLDQDTRKRAEVVKVEKSDYDLLHARSVQVELNGSNKSGSVSEFEITTNDLLQTRIYASDTLANFTAGNVTNFPNLNYSLNDLKGNLSLSDLPAFAEAKAFTSRGNTSVNGSTSVGGYFSSISNTSMSKGFFQSISDLNIESSSHYMFLAPGNTGAVFELTP